MTKEEKRYLKNKMQEEFFTLNKNIAELQNLCKPISPECALGDLTRFELIHDQTISKKALELAQVRSNNLQYALLKIEENDFGLCQECKEEIIYQRLVLVPESRLCIACASNKD
ncbi:MAG: transcriptional regulator [Arcobacter sp.]|nr:MAG: transcriptional regulator [Arcobacter sp.]